MPKGIKGFQKGHSVPNELRLKISRLKSGIKLSAKTKLKMSISHTGKIMSEESKKKIGLSNSVRLLGKKQSAELIKKRVNARAGYRHSEETRRKISESQKGNKAPNWKGGVTPIHKAIRRSVEFKLWREAVFSRDNWTCLWCGKRGGELHPDHIKPFSQYPDLRFDIANGRTLCKDCHMKTDTWGSKSIKKVMP